MTASDTVSEFVSDSVNAPDGTTIGFRRIGTGSPVVIVHGSISTGEQWLAVGTQLAATNSVYIIDRRGRGLSGDAPEYSLGVEAADIAAVVARAALDTGQTPVLLGHSYGAICALETIRRGTDVAALVLYEPPLPVEGPVAGANLAPYAEAIDRGDREAAVRIAAEHFLRLPPELAEALEAGPGWPAILELAPTWTRELVEIDGSAALLTDFGALSVRTLLVHGEVSSPFLITATAYLRDALPDATERVLPRQEHLAHVTAPHLLVGEIREFAGR
ncbi:alpha/beta fold hydrolase [Gordonia soli]|uniref:Putative hydrolase n=1 Tax=Gordonia soli NBRC 108243 TaxID=1223545 RepID=M0QF48_9ACTN|nr:alpha/beta hydrolase [Gordonia soli]GAC66916.1 putative hydrolase [Gordonia soli NBRC 108243]